MTDYFATNYGDMTGYMPDCTETYVVDLIKQYDKQTNNDPVFSKMGINISNFCTNGVDVIISPEQTAGIGAIAISASGQYQTDVPYNGFIYISSDYGVTWTQKTQRDYWSGVSISASGQYQTAVSSALQSDQVSPGFIYISSDYGVTWTQTTQKEVWTSVSISASGQYQTAVSSGLGSTPVQAYPGFMYISSDYGVTWTQNPQKELWNSVSISASGQYQTTTSFGLQSGNLSSGFIYISSDYGVTWTQNPQKPVGLGVAVNATGQYQIIAAGLKTFYSTDYGNNWNQLSFFPTTTVTAAAISASGQIVVFRTTTLDYNGVKIYNNSGFLNLSNVKPAAPSTSKGSAGDVNGMMAVNEIGLYYCSANYTSGSVDIWKRIEWSTDTW